MIAKSHQSPDHQYLRGDRQGDSRIFPNAANFIGSRYTAERYYFRQDPHHYLPETGAAMISELLG